MNRNAQWEVIFGDTEPQFTLIAEADGAQVQFAKELGYALQIVSGSEYLQKCSTESLRAAFLNVAGMGLSLNPAMKLAYLVPREGRACLDISYIGLVHVATESGAVLAAKADIVRKNDRFEFHGMFQIPLHQYDPFASNEARGEIIGVYCVARLADGSAMVDTMNRETLDKIRGSSKTSDKPSNPWNKWYDEMAKKSVIKRAYKSWPQQRARMSKVVDYLNEQEGNAIDITPPRPALRHDVTQAARTALAGSDTPDALALLTDLEVGIMQGGQAWYAERWKTLPQEQRAWVGAEHHQRLWALGQQVDDERGAGA